MKIVLAAPVLIDGVVMIESWKCIRGYNKAYSISNLGRVRSNSRYFSTPKGWSWLFGRILRTFPDTGGHLQVGLTRHNKRRTFLVHRLVLEEFVGPCPDGLQCRHLDGNKSNNRLENICWGTPKENKADSIRHGTAFRPGFGESHYGSKLTNREAKRIRRLYATGDFSQQELAEMFNTCQPVVSRIIRYVSYTD